MEVHSKSKTFAIEECKKQTVLQRAVKNHKDVEQVQHFLTKKPPMKCDLCQATFSLMVALRIHKVIAHGDQRSHPKNCTCDAYKVKDIKTEPSISFNEDKADIHEEAKNIVPFNNHQEDETKKPLVKGLILKTDEAVLSIACQETKASLIQMTLTPKGTWQSFSSFGAKYDKFFMSAKVECQRLPVTQDSLDSKVTLIQTVNPVNLDIPEAKDPLEISPFKGFLQICNKNLTHVGYQNIHVNSVHEGIKPIEACKKDFTKSKAKSLKHIDADVPGFHMNAVHVGYQNIHVNSVHESTKPFKCETCNRNFSNAVTYKRHTKWHEGIKECKICNKTFSHADIYKKHVMSHTTGLKHKCEICKKHFPGANSLRFHINTVHVDLKPFECEFCLKSFKSAECRKAHIEACHKGPTPYKCRKCNKNFPNPRMLREHMHTVREGDTSDNSNTRDKIAKILQSE